MSIDRPDGWEPDPGTMGNWRAMFEQDRGGKSPGVPPNGQQHAPFEPPLDDASLAPDLTTYRPWTLQRGRSRPAMMLELRRYEPRSGLWSGIQLSYPTLIAVKYTGDKLLSLDFGLRQFVIEGRGLDELAHRLQLASVVSLQEYTEVLWPSALPKQIITCIRKLSPRP